MATSPFPPDSVGRTGVAIASAESELETLTPEDVADLLKITLRQLNRGIARGTIPRPDIVISLQAPRWKRSTIEALLNPGRKAVADAN